MKVVVYSSKAYSALFLKRQTSIVTSCDTWIVPSR